jgi:hypothetical protein
VASPYLIRNYLITGNPFYSDFSKIVMVSYLGDGRLIESPAIEYQNIYDLALKKPIQTISTILKNIGIGLISLPTKLIGSYLISFLSLIGLVYLWQKYRQKYYFIFLTILLGFLIPVAIVQFSDRYLILLIILFYFLASIGFFKLAHLIFKNNLLLRSLLIIYLASFIVLGGLIGLAKATIPYIPHSFYQRFDAQEYYTNLQEFYDYIKNNTGQDEVIMVSRQPYSVHYFTERPTILFPFTDRVGVQEFIKKYQVRWLIWMGQPSKIDGKYWKFFLPEEIPENIKPVFKNKAGDLFKLDYYLEN